jgi:hypothetical protein
VTFYRRPWGRSSIEKRRALDDHTMSASKAKREWISVMRAPATTEIDPQGERWIGGFAALAASRLTGPRTSVRRASREGVAVAMSARTPEEASKLIALLDKKYRYLDYKWDLVFWVTALPLVAAAADITRLLFAGDWDFWTDWKDRQWWVTITPFAMIIIPSALQYIAWQLCRFPVGFTYTAVGL